MGRPIDKIDTNKDEAKYNISPSSVIQNIPTKPDYGEDWKKAYYENAYSQGYINGYLKGKKDQMQQKIGRWLPDNRPGGGFWVCSECKFPSEAFAADVLYKYCPNCGSYMGGKNDEDD